MSSTRSNTSRKFRSVSTRVWSMPDTTCDTIRCRGLGSRFAQDGEDIQADPRSRNGRRSLGGGLQSLPFGPTWSCPNHANGTGTQLLFKRDSQSEASFLLGIRVHQENEGKEAKSIRNILKCPRTIGSAQHIANVLDSPIERGLGCRCGSYGRERQLRIVEAELRIYSANLWIEHN